MHADTKEPDALPPIADWDPIAAVAAAATVPSSPTTVLLADPFAESTWLLQAMLPAIGLRGLPMPSVCDAAVSRPTAVQAARVGLLDLQCPTPIHGLLLQRWLDAAESEFDSAAARMPWIALLPAATNEVAAAASHAEVPAAVRIVAALRYPWRTSQLAAAIDAAIADSVPSWVGPQRRRTATGGRQAA